mgnify:CR=1 FL=1
MRDGNRYDGADIFYGYVCFSLPMRDGNNYE